MIVVIWLILTLIIIAKPYLITGTINTNKLKFYKYTKIVSDLNYTGLDTPFLSSITVISGQIPTLPGNAK